MTHTIRKATTDDAYGIAKLYFEETGRIVSSVANMLEKHPGIVAILDDIIVGFAYTDKFSPEILRLDNLFVRPDQRNRELGTRLMRDLEEIIDRTFPPDARHGYFMSVWAIKRSSQLNTQRYSRRNSVRNFRHTRRGGRELVPGTQQSCVWQKWPAVTGRRLVGSSRFTLTVPQPLFSHLHSAIRRHRTFVALTLLSS